MIGAWLGWGTPDWRTRRAEVDDCESFATLHGKSFARDWSAEEFESLISEPNVAAHALHARPRGPVAGFALSRRAADEAEILSIAVDPKRRGKGGGHVLLAAHLTALAGLGVIRVFLEVDEGNGAAGRLYARFGFREVGRRESYYARADGTRGAARILSTDLG